MNHLILTAEQAQFVRQASELVEIRDAQGASLGHFTNGPVEVQDEQGRTIGHLTPLTAEDIEDIKWFKERRATDRPLIPMEQVWAHLRRLEEIRNTEGLDEDRMLDLLRRMRAGEDV